jgi:DNA ligase (NAD+)
MDIKGISEAIIRKLYQNEFLKSSVDFYYLAKKEKELSQLEGLQEKSVDNLLKNIEKSKKIFFSHLLTALGIPLLGKIKCQKMVLIYPNLSSLIKSIEKNELELVGEKLGVETQKEFEKFFQKLKNLQTLKELVKIGF